MAAEGDGVNEPKRIEDNDYLMVVMAIMDKFLRNRTIRNLKEVLEYTDAMRNSKTKSDIFHDGYYCLPIIVHGDKLPLDYSTFSFSTIAYQTASSLSRKSFMILTRDKQRPISREDIPMMLSHEYVLNHAMMFLVPRLANRILRNSIATHLRLEPKDISLFSTNISNKPGQLMCISGKSHVKLDGLSFIVGSFHCDDGLMYVYLGNPQFGKKKIWADLDINYEFEEYLKELEPMDEKIVFASMK